MNMHEMYQDLILQYDLLDEREKQQVDEHIKTCKQCERYFETFQQMNEALDLISIEDNIEEFQNEANDHSLHKKRIHFSKWKQFVLTVSLLLIVGFSISFTTPGKAAIQKALNRLLAEKVMEDNKPLPKKDGKQKVLYSVCEDVDGGIFKTYSTGDKVRIEHEFGYDIMINETAYHYNKSEHTFTIEEIRGMDDFASFLKNKDENDIKYLGTDTFFGRPVEKYSVKIDEFYTDEYWFDKKYGKVIRVFTIHNGNKEEDSNIIELKEIEIDPNSDLFDTTPPKGAKVIDHRNSES
ncbi:hypothetical protein [Bacillus sp. FJAT-47783]|uniref:hypothetical protein n=1 Tax=Bacillus sp. FJAT-47783 TaxID=2922712 RepID=UPI001FAE7331|nr:hypothetical protein [Bacillus sp. FJAT-47783]